MVEIAEGRMQGPDPIIGLLGAQVEDAGIEEAEEPKPDDDQEDRQPGMDFPPSRSRLQRKIFGISHESISFFVHPAF